MTDPADRKRIERTEGLPREELDRTVIRRDEGPDRTADGPVRKDTGRAGSWDEEEDDVVY